MTAELGKLFDPNDGAFAVNIRDITVRDVSGDDTELRESLKYYGWREELPALVDENGIVLVGHRRIKIAKSLGIKPVIKKLTLGKGDAADAERLKLALISNIGFKPMTAADRKNIAAHLYLKKGWIMAQIAEALNVSQRQISTDLGDLEVTSKSKPRRKTASNPKGAGRPKGNKKDASKLKQTPLERARQKYASHLKGMPRDGVLQEVRALLALFKLTVADFAVATIHHRR